jgi:hypothetical protein
MALFVEQSLSDSLKLVKKRQVSELAELGEVAAINPGAAGNDSET